MSEEKAALPNFGRGLSARLLALTICFVMVSEILIYAPSIARFRNDWLSEKLASAYLAILALEATPDFMIDPELELRLLDNAGARVIALKSLGGKNLIMRGSTPGNIVINKRSRSQRPDGDDPDQGCIRDPVGGRQPPAAGEGANAPGGRCVDRRGAGRHAAARGDDLLFLAHPWPQHRHLAGDGDADLPVRCNGCWSGRCAT